MGEIQRSLREWAEFFNVPFGTFRGWAYELNKRSPFYHSDARIIAAHGAAKRNYTNVMEKLTVD
jgi:hypothetical protein